MDIVVNPSCRIRSSTSRGVPAHILNQLSIQILLNTPERSEPVTTIVRCYSPVLLCLFILWMEVALPSEVNRLIVYL